MLLKRLRTLPLITGAFLFSTHAQAAWVYHCEPDNQGHSRQNFTNDYFPYCEGGGQWREVTSFTDESITQEQVGELVAAIALVLLIGFAVKLARRILNV